MRDRSGVLPRRNCPITTSSQLRASASHRIAARCVALGLAGRQIGKQSSKKVRGFLTPAEAGVDRGPRELPIPTRSRRGRHMFAWLQCTACGILPNMYYRDTGK
ncbi:hypothetical protein F5X99DRAFT_386604 [Biscogniauxia marginata]|nr:hypothetical protein F5X99DRAFT_386604 [Biscogniauxia marginata]